MRVVVVGLGAVGSNVARQLLAHDEVDQLSIVHPRPGRVAGAVSALGAPGRTGTGGPVRVRLLAGDAAGLDRLGPEICDHDVAVLSSAALHRPAAEVALARGMHVVSTADDPAEVRALLALDAGSRRRGLSVVAGAAVAPGLSCVLAAQAARRLERVEEVHVASFGTGGPACARRHHRALSSVGVTWRDGAWRRHAGGSGRELVWFPDPVGGADCYCAGLADPLLLVPAFPGARRVTSRLEATRRDRMTAWLPMMRPPHPEGTVGAVRAEVRGWSAGVPTEAILGASVRPALGAGTVAAHAALWAGAGRLCRPGAGGLAEMVTDPGQFLRELGAAGITTAVFEGGRAS
ncbi:MAG: saccharopine dehydrogenase NADP-binding domain-containing protein [Acidimicrobiales bacterium]